MIIRAHNEFDYMAQDSLSENERVVEETERFWLLERIDEDYQPFLIRGREQFEDGTHEELPFSDEKRARVFLRLSQVTGEDVSRLWGTGAYADRDIPVFVIPFGKEAITAYFWARSGYGYEDVASSLGFERTQTVRNYVSEFLSDE